MYLGIDFGSSTTKFVLMDNYKIIERFRIARDESIDIILDQIDLTKVEKIMAVGTGASFLEGNIRGIETLYFEEFRAVALGGYFLSELEECMVVSLGTGTSFTYINRDRREHAGGSGIGGALLQSLAQNGLGMEDVGEFMELAARGDINKADLLIKDISKTAVGGMLGDVTVANMAKLNKDSSKEDYAFGACNLVFQNVGVMAVLADRPYNTKKIVVMGSISNSKIARRCFDDVGKLFGYRFFISEEAMYGVAIGAILLGDENYINSLSIYDSDMDCIDYIFE